VIPILHLAAQKTVKKWGVAHRSVSSHVLVRAKSERSDSSRLEFKKAKQIAVA